MRNWTGITVAAMIVALSGCYTYRAKVAHKRGQLYAEAQGAAGDELGTAVGREMAEANIESGADRITPEEAPLTVEAATANAAGIAEEREARGLIGRALLGLAENIPWIGGALGTVLGVVEWLRRRSAVLSGQKAGEIAGVLGRFVASKAAGLGKHLEAETPKLEAITIDEVKAALDKAKSWEL